MNKPVRFILPFAAVLACAAPAFAASMAQTQFATPQSAVDALISAVQKQDKPALLAIFGKGGEEIISSGDPVADEDAARAFAAAYAQGHSLEPQKDGSEVLTLGKDDWPFPIPLEQVDGKWQFNTGAGLDQLLDRRIGRDELLTIKTMLAAAEAEQDYFNRVERGTGTGAYADRLASTPGTEDGLYWPAAPGKPASPMGPLVESAQAEGYPGAVQPGGEQMPYHGYYYGFLKGQGPDAPGGAKAYTQNGRLAGGFGIIAWPARYGNSGIMTFIINQDGVVFQKDLGPDTAKLAGEMSLFNPDESWARVDLTQ